MKPTDTEYWIRIALVVGVCLVAAFDLLLLARYGPNATISIVLRKACQQFPILPYLIAFGMGAFLYHISIQR